MANQTLEQAQERGGATAAKAPYVPRCVQRTGKECRDCVECLSALPAGETCESACRWASHCRRVFGIDTSQAFCDWAPSRFTSIVRGTNA